MNNIENLVKEWLRTKAKEELLSVQRKEIERQINQSLISGEIIKPEILNLLGRVLKKTGARPEQTSKEKK